MSSATRWGIAGGGNISHDFVTCLNLLPKSQHQVIYLLLKYLYQNILQKIQLFCCISSLEGQSTLIMRE